MNLNFSKDLHLLFHIRDLMQELSALYGNALEYPLFFNFELTDRAFSTKLYTAHKNTWTVFSQLPLDEATLLVLRAVEEALEGLILFQKGLWQEHLTFQPLYLNNIFLSKETFQEIEDIIKNSSSTFKAQMAFNKWLGEIAAYIAHSYFIYIPNYEDTLHHTSALVQIKNFWSQIIIFWSSSSYSIVIFFHSFYKSIISHCSTFLIC